jgi:hypothetical protein
MLTHPEEHREAMRLEGWLHKQASRKKPAVRS